MTEEGINMDAQMQIDSKILKLVEEYAECDRESGDINARRSEIRRKAGELGFESIEFQHAVMRAKKMNKTTREAYEANVQRIISVVEGHQFTLWPEEAEKQKKRAEKKAAKVTGKEGAIDSDTNPRSDPNTGGAATKMHGDGSDVVMADPEQIAGEAALNAGLPKTRKSQSQIAADKLSDAKLN